MLRKFRSIYRENIAAYNIVIQQVYVTESWWVIEVVSKPFFYYDVKVINP